MHVFKLRNPMVIFSHTFTHSFHALSCNVHAISHDFGYFSLFWANFNMFGIKKHVLELRKSFVVLVEAVGLQKGSKAPKKS